jgi:hypothetical protein
MSRSEPEVTYHAAKKHRAVRTRKLQRIAGLQALIATYEARPRESYDRAYVRNLKSRLHAIEQQLAVMKI